MPPTATLDTPWPWNPTAGRPQPAVGGAGAAGDAVDMGPRNLGQSNLSARLVEQFGHFKVRSTSPGHECFVGEAVRAKLPAWYWIRTRPHWPDLSELMLYWLAAPVSTAGLERGFSFQTLIDQDTRRRRRTMAHMRDDMMVHLHRVWLEKKLATIL